MIIIDVKKRFVVVFLFLTFLLFSNSISLESELLYQNTFIFDDITNNTDWVISAYGDYDHVEKLQCEFFTQAALKGHDLNGGCLQIYKDTASSEFVALDFYTISYDTVFNIDEPTTRNYTHGYWVFKFDWIALNQFVQGQTVSAIDFRLAVNYGPSIDIFELDCFDTHYPLHDFRSNLWYDEFTCYLLDDPTIDEQLFSFLVNMTEQSDISDNGLYLSDLRVFYQIGQENEISDQIVNFDFVSLDFGETLNMLIQFMPLLMLGKLIQTVSGKKKSGV